MKTKSDKKFRTNKKTGQPRIVLIGFMGAGKTSIAGALAQKLDCEWVDSDEYIEVSENRTVSQIFENLGESVFREIETAALGELLSNQTMRIIALGGGAWTIEENRKIIKENNFVSVWLDAPFDLCWERIKKSGANRPLATKKAAARKLYNERQPIYAQADLRIEIEKKDSAENAAEKILNQIEAHLSLQKNN
jgi:shikimate kinase